MQIEAAWDEALKRLSLVIASIFEVNNEMDLATA